MRRALDHAEVSRFRVSSWFKMQYDSTDGTTIAYRFVHLFLGHTVNV